MQNVLNGAGLLFIMWALTAGWHEMRCFCCGCVVFPGTSHSRQVCMSTVFLHCWQRTEQHQENLQEQRWTTSARPARKPGPQHNSSHPSGANREVPRTWNKVKLRVIN